MAETRSFMIKFARFPRNAGIEYPIHSFLRNSLCDYYVALHAIGLNTTIITRLIDDTTCENAKLQGWGFLTHWGRDKESDFLIIHVQ